MYVCIDNIPWCDVMTHGNKLKLFISEDFDFLLTNDLLLNDLIAVLFQISRIPKILEVY